MEGIGDVPLLAAVEVAALAETTTLDDLDLAAKRVFVVEAEAPALHAFEEMIR